MTVSAGERGVTKKKSRHHFPLYNDPQYSDNISICESGQPCPCQNYSQGPPAEKTRKTISAESSVMSPRRTNRSRNWTELNWNCNNSQFDTRYVFWNTHIEQKEHGFVYLHKTYSMIRDAETTLNADGQLCLRFVFSYIASSVLLMRVPSLRYSLEGTDNSSIEKAETSLDWQEHFSQLPDTTDALPCHSHLPVCLWIMDPHSRTPKNNASHGNEVLPQDTTHLIQRPSYQRRSPRQDPAGNWTTRRSPDDHKEMQTAVVWSCFSFIRSGKNHLERHSERGKKTRQTEEEMGRQRQGMDMPGVRKVPEGSGEQGKMEKTGCEIIRGAPTTLAVNG